MLNNGVAWSDAAGQIFFTLGACLGIMSAYGSYAPSTADVYTDNAIICYINCAPRPTRLPSSLVLTANAIIVHLAH